MKEQSLKRASAIKFASMCSLPYGTELTILGQVGGAPRRWRVSVPESSIGINEIDVNTDRDISGRFVVIRQANKGLTGHAVPVEELEEEAASIEDSILSTLLRLSK